MQALEAQVVHRVCWVVNEALLTVGRCRGYARVRADANFAWSLQRVAAPFPVINEAGTIYLCCLTRLVEQDLFTLDIALSTD